MLLLGTVGVAATFGVPCGSGMFGLGLCPSLVIITTREGINTGKGEDKFRFYLSCVLGACIRCV